MEKVLLIIFILVLFIGFMVINVINIPLFYFLYYPIWGGYLLALILIFYSISLFTKLNKTYVLLSLIGITAFLMGRGMAFISL